MSLSPEDLEPALRSGFAEALRVTPEQVGRYVRDGGGELPGGPASLLAWDIHGIHDFVFDTSNAMVIRGGSDILSRLDRELAAGQVLGLEPAQIVVSSAGHGLAVVKEAQIPRARANFFGYLAERTLVASGTLAFLPLQGGHFGRQVKALEGEIEKGRQKNLPSTEPFVPFFAERCRVCGRRAASSLERRTIGDRWECRPCALKLEVANRARQQGGESGEFEEIADRNGFYAVLYLDGNGYGRLMSELSSPIEYATISQAITRVFRQAADQTLTRYGIRHEGNADATAIRQCQRPIQGGDDLVLIVPGDLALPLTRDLQQRILAQADGEPSLRRHSLGVCAGLAIAGTGLPVRHLLSEAQGNLRSAKRRIYQAPPGEDPRVALDFSVILQGQPTIEHADRPRFQEAAPEILPSGRPYTLAELELFSQRYRILKAKRKVGRGQLFELARQAAKGRHQLRNHLLFQVARYPEFRELAEELGGMGGGLCEPSAQAYEAAFLPIYGDRRVFDLGDMIELSRFFEEAEP